MRRQTARQRARLRKELGGIFVVCPSLTNQLPGFSPALPYIPRWGLEGWEEVVRNLVWPPEGIRGHSQQYFGGNLLPLPLPCPCMRPNPFPSPWT